MPRRENRRRSAPRHSDQQSHDVRHIGHMADNAGVTNHQPNQKNHDALAVELQARTRIVFAAHPNVTRQRVHHSGHAAEIGAVHGTTYCATLESAADTAMNASRKSEFCRASIIEPSW